MKGLIVYQGKYGATAQYAEWLRQDLSIPALSSDRCTDLDINEKEMIVMGSSVYIGKLQLEPWLRKNIATLKNKALFLFVVSGTTLNETEKLAGYIRNSVPTEIASNCHIYFLPGRLRYKQLSPRDKLILNIGALFSGSRKSWPFHGCTVVLRCR